MALCVTITSHSYIVETDGERADPAPMKTHLCGLYTSSQSWERWCATCVVSGLPNREGLHIFPHLHYFQVFLVPPSYSALLHMWSYFNHLCLNGQHIDCDSVCTLNPISWSPLLGWWPPVKTSIWGECDALPLECWKTWRSAFSSSAVILVLTFQLLY